MNSKLDILSQHIEHILRAEGEIEETENLFKLLVEYYPLEEAVRLLRCFPPTYEKR